MKTVNREERVIDLQLHHTASENYIQGKVDQNFQQKKMNNINYFFQYVLYRCDRYHSFNVSNIT